MRILPITFFKPKSKNASYILKCTLLGLQKRIIDLVWQNQSLLQYCSLYICDVFIIHKAQKQKGQENNKKKHKLQKLYRYFVLQELKPRPWAADYKPPAPADENSNVKKTPEEIEREIKVGFHIRCF